MFLESSPGVGASNPRPIIKPARYIRKRLDSKLVRRVAGAVAANIAMSACPGATGGEADMARTSRLCSD
jgi:hypothetical protein